MKKLIIGFAGIMIIGLTLATIYYEKPTEIMLPSLTQTIGKEEHLELQKDPEQQSEPLQPIYVNDETAYSLQNNELHITFDNGNHWSLVPVDVDSLFSGEYNGNKQELIEHSFILNEHKTAFIYSEGRNWEGSGISLIYSVDKGSTWHESVVAEQYPSMRFRKVKFLSDSFGYVIASGDRTMSQELSTVFVTHDGGESWEETNRPDITRLIYDGGFVDETTGFLSFGTINPEEPDFYVTEDGGYTWSKAHVHIPPKYNKIFVTAEIPEKENNQLVLLVNQGPYGDYLGGKVKGKFISTNHGKTWEFSEEVHPDETKTN